MGSTGQHVGEAGDEAPLLDGQGLDLAGDAADRLVSPLVAGGGRSTSGCWGSLLPPKRPRRTMWITSSVWAVLGALQTDASTDGPAVVAAADVHSRGERVPHPRPRRRPAQERHAAQPRDARPGHARHAALPRPRHRRALLRAAHLHRLSHLLQRAGAAGHLRACHQRSRRSREAAGPRAPRHRLRPRLHHRAHRLHLRHQRRDADALAPARAPPGRAGLRPAVAALRQVQGAQLHGAGLGQRCRRRGARALRGAAGRLARRSTRTCSRPASPAKTPAS